MILTCLILFIPFVIVLAAVAIILPRMKEVQRYANFDPVTKFELEAYEGLVNQRQRTNGAVKGNKRKAYSPS
jgi:hypothetical protein